MLTYNSSLSPSPLGLSPNLRKRTKSEGLTPEYPRHPAVLGLGLGLVLGSQLGLGLGLDICVCRV